MRILADPDTGEVVEVLETNVVGLEPYDYRQAKAAHIRASKERREATDTYTKAIDELGAAERHYRMVLSQQMLIAKGEHGATIAEQVAKGTSAVLEARERFTIAEGMKYAALERIRGCDGDRQGIAQLVKWSQAQATGPWGEG